MIREDDYFDAPDYRAGVLMGRRQALNEIRERLAASSPQAAESTLTEIKNWCALTETDLDVELLLLVREQQLRARPDEDEFP